MIGHTDKSGAESNYEKRKSTFENNSFGSGGIF